MQLDEFIKILFHECALDRRRYIASSVSMRPVEAFHGAVAFTVNG